jgi:hypothetical protein
MKMAEGGNAKKVAIQVNRPEIPPSALSRSLELFLLGGEGQVQQRRWPL